MPDALGDRMKLYEGIEARRKFMPLLPILVRLDGKSFSRYTSGLARPYDERLVKTMHTVTSYLVSTAGSLMGYTQSDEISLLFYSSDIDKQVYFDGKIMKLTSVLASLATAKFNSVVGELIPERKGKLAFFDCRAWQVPSKVEAVNAFLWRELDATKNSISSAARCYYSHKQLHGKNTADMQELLFQKGVNWNDYPAYFKRGTYIRRRRIVTKFTPDELKNLPVHHEARQRNDVHVHRTLVGPIEMPPLKDVINRVAVFFEGIDPLVEEND